jgi:hypothetical protein
MTTRTLNIDERRADSIRLSQADLNVIAHAVSALKDKHEAYSPGMKASLNSAHVINACGHLTERLAILRDGYGKLPETMTLLVGRPTLSQDALKLIATLG